MTTEFLPMLRSLLVAAVALLMVVPPAFAATGRITSATHRASP